MEALAPGVDEAPPEVLGPGEGDGVHERVEAAERAGRAGHGRGHLTVVLHIERQDRLA